MESADGSDDETDFTLWSMSSLAHIANDLDAQITAAAFSPVYELIWVGDSTGRLTSHSLPDLSLYSASFVDKPYASCILGLTTDDFGGVSTLTSSNVLHHSLGGLRRHGKAIPPEHGSATCFIKHSVTGQPGFLVGSSTGKVLSYNLQSDRMSAIGDVSSSSIQCVEKSEQLFLGLESGMVEFRDPRNLRRIHALLAHSGPVTSLASFGYCLYSSGIEHRSQYSQLPGSIIKVVDTRTFRELPPIIAPSGAIGLKIQQSIVGHLLHVQCGSGQEVSTFFLDYPDADCCTTIVDMDYAITTVGCGIANGLFMGNSDGTGSFWVLKESESVPTSYYGVQVEEAFPPEPSSVSIDFESSALSTVGWVSESDESLLSVWPEELVVPNPAIDMFPIDPVAIPGLNWVGGSLGFAPYPIKDFKRNNLESVRPFTTARWAGTKKKNSSALSKAISTVYGQDFPDKQSLLEKGYARAILKRGRLGTDGFNYSRFNNTQFSGLDNLIPNSYCNAALQCLFFIAPFRFLMINHTCEKEICLICELGFLFFMMWKKPERPVEPRNFLRALQLIPESAALNLLETADPSSESALFVRIQSFISFVLEFLWKEIELSPTEADASTTFFRNIFASEISHRIQCLSAKEHETHRVTSQLQFKLKYHNKSQRDSFETVAANSLGESQQMKIWCPDCNNYCQSRLSKSISKLPAVLIFAAHIKSENDMAHWRPSNFSLTENNVDGKSRRSTPWLPASFKITISDNQPHIKKVFLTDPPLQDDISNPNEAIYDLFAVISQIHHPNARDKDSVMNAHHDEHLVAHIRVCDHDIIPPLQNDSPFLCFNDFVITPSSLAEALEFGYVWKQPCNTFYRRRSFHQLVPSADAINPVLEVMTNSSPIHSGISQHTAEVVKLLPGEELSKGSLVAIDSEFVCVEKEEVEVHEDGQKSVIRPARHSLARVSLIRGYGDLIGVPFMDNHIVAVEAVVDYMTKYSGIHPGDLDARISNKHLSTLKWSYMCLRSMVDKGVIFVGHGLKKDFQIINLYVPPEQIKDTVELFWINGRRFLSLRFLALHVLGMSIQENDHDSIEDARSALFLYQKYIELQSQNAVEETLQRLYDIGNRVGFKQ